MKHYSLKNPVISDRQLATYMSAGKLARGDILRQCKYPKVAQSLHIKPSQFYLSQHLDGMLSQADLKICARDLGNQIVSSSFEYDLNHHNARCIDCFLCHIDRDRLPDSDALTHLDSHPIFVNGLKIHTDIPLCVQRLSPNRKMQQGGIAFHFAPLSVLDASTAAWHAAFIHGYTRQSQTEHIAETDPDLCLLVDVFSGDIVRAPADSVSRYSEIRRSCAEIVQDWNSITPPAALQAIQDQAMTPDAGLLPAELTKLLTGSIADALTRCLSKAA